MRLPRLRRTSDAISPTAHYTGYVWARNGLGPRELASRTGALMHAGLRPGNALLDRAGGPSLDALLLSRHRAIDALLREAIAEGRVGQVVEIAAGLSPRGHRFANEYGTHLTYVEADLPDMAARKRDALAGLSLPPTHRVVDFDALEESGPRSLTAILGSLDPEVGTAIITEGLLNYLPREAVTGLWARMAAGLQAFPHGLYLSDLHLSAENSTPATRTFIAMLGAFVRGRIHLHFTDAADAVAALTGAGFGSAALRRPDDPEFDLPEKYRAGARLVRIVEARTP